MAADQEIKYPSPVVPCRLLSSNETAIGWSRQRGLGGPSMADPRTRLGEERHAL
jgi:hypothetical protein